jgi:hypothetical protein
MELLYLEYARNEKPTGMLGLFRNMVMHHRHVTAYPGAHGLKDAMGDNRCVQRHAPSSM